MKKLTNIQLEKLKGTLSGNNGLTQSESSIVSKLVSTGYYSEFYSTEPGEVYHSTTNLLNKY